MTLKQRTWLFWEGDHQPTFKNGRWSTYALLDGTDEEAILQAGNFIKGHESLGVAHVLVGRADDDVEDPPSLLVKGYTKMEHWAVVAISWKEEE